MGWRLFQRDGSMWSNIIYNKYVRNKNVDELCNKNATNCSSTWRGIAHGIKLLLEVNFWSDSWVLGLDTLSDYALYPMDQSNNNEKVSSFNENGKWSLFKLRVAVPWNIIQRIVSIHINVIGDGVDCRIWGSDSEGNFTVKSAYSDFFEGNPSEQWKFDLVWKIKIPPKIQCFLLLLPMVKFLLMIRGCPFFSKIWKDCRYGTATVTGNAGDWRNWFHDNLVSKNKVNGSSMWIYFVFTLCWVKLNVDGSRNSLGCIAVGGVIRNSLGQWLGGFTANKGSGSGLLYAWQAGYKFLIVETDSANVVKLLSQGVQDCHPLFYLLQKCQSLIQEDWVCKIVNIYREANKMADYLAKMGQHSDLGVNFLEDLPVSCLEIIKKDDSGWSASRSCSYIS
ncbi:hypothetical protein ACOSQ3_010259 [Xanthoceras sorbifolium]